MLLPSLTSAASGPPLSPAVAVVLTGPAGFQVAYDVSAELSGMEQPDWSEAAIVVPYMADAAIPEAPASAAIETSGGGDVVAVTQPTPVEPVIIECDTGPKAGLPAQTGDHPRPPMKMAPHHVVQMMFDRPALPAAGAVADSAAPALPQTLVPVSRQAMPVLDSARVAAPDDPIETISRKAAALMDGPSAARAFNAISTSLTVNPTGFTAPAPPVVPQSTVTLPPPNAAAVVERPLPLPTGGAAINPPPLVVPVVKWQDPKAVVMAGGDPSEAPFGLAADTASVGGTGRTADLQSAPGLARHVAQQLAVTVTQTAGQPTEIALNPEELGRVRMSMSMTDGTLILQINAERPETTELLRRHIDTLAQEFRSLGYDDISFDFGEGRAKDQNDRKVGPLVDYVEETAENHSSDHVVARPVRGGLDLRL